MFSHTLTKKGGEMKQHHYQELTQSAIDQDVIKLNFRSLEGYEAFSKFLSLCDSKDKRLGPQVCDRQIQNRYSHLYEGYWCATRLAQSYDP